MIKYVGIKEAANYLGVSPQTIRRWEKEGRLLPCRRTKGKQRRYNLETLMPTSHNKIQEQILTMAYARVSSHDQKADLERQAHLLETYCVTQGWTYEIISDLGSGMNYQKKGLKRLLNLILAGKINRLVLTHKDRLLRFGSELIFSLCELKGVEVVIINKGKEPSFEEELAQDVLEIITVFSARLYGSRSRKNKQLMNNLQKVMEAKV
jgi:excisionase family DNA binding protein